MRGRVEGYRGGLSVRVRVRVMGCLGGSVRERERSDVCLIIVPVCFNYGSVIDVIF